ncbi:MULTISPECIES: hypothetical protein [unclassified Crossiella]|uniref:hypothetical protein n=1 Tax=unclassified Crossiella TaxID=2620835 RepID=UPI001FFE3C28|nr:MULTISPECIES: hypothetical protein [unclassified Crossiella]MCK2244489.1 hypothetical protein [Crossiella sp. S99.2]MCK2258120.1 hypothetical protein [Crossiella sp. S99.1]
MSVQLAFGLTAAAGSRCWLPTSGGRLAPRPAEDRAGAHPPGAPVAIGPAEAGPEQVREACRQLVLLVGKGTEAVAAAGVDLGGGFTSARLAGARGDRRDAVLAALRVLGADGADRLGDRSARLVALFGPSATKRVGAAAHTAVAEERWAALGLAAAASDLLGPEQLERLLELRAPDGIDPFPRGAAATLAGHLSLALSGYPQPRRLALILSLWEQVCARLLHRQRLTRLAATQTKADRIEKLRTRHQDFFDGAILRQAGYSLGNRMTLAAAARWRPPSWWATWEITWLLHDAIAATALLRFARTVSDEGLAAAIEQHRGELLAADAILDEDTRSKAARRREGDYSHPARPGCYLHQVLQSLEPGRAITPKTENAVRTRIAMARNYGEVVLDAVTEHLPTFERQYLHHCWNHQQRWQAGHLRRWRAAAGFTRAPGSWEQPPLEDAHAEELTQPLAQRLAANPDADPVTVEEPHDLLWYADLADALAPFAGHESATAVPGESMPELSYAGPPDQEQPSADSVPLAAAEVAQLVAFGAKPPPRCRSWTELAEGVSAAAVIAEASVGAFPIPAEVSTVDKQIVPGAELVVELGREPRQLAAWSGYMGNCIGDTWYAEVARRGQCVLMALRHPVQGHIVANLDIRRHTGGWHVHELRARFNDDLDESLAAHIKNWVTALPVPAPPEPEPLEPVAPARARGGGARRNAATRLPADLTRDLTAEVERELASTPVAAARRTYVTLARGLGRAGHPADFEPEAAVIALKRLSPAEHVDLLRTALANGLGATALWHATRVRPLTTAVGRLDPAQREYDRVATLTGGGPLPRSLRALVRRAAITPAHAMDEVARAVRAAIGALAHDEALGRSVARRPAPELVCALAIATTCATPSTMDGVLRVTEPKKATVPGFPAGDLFDEDGPWQRALAAAAELGAPVQVFADRIAEHGLLIPAALLGKGGWPALWQRAHR